jgi:hypothetical protein
VAALSLEQQEQQEQHQRLSLQLQADVALAATETLAARERASVAEVLSLLAALVQTPRYSVYLLY